MKCYRPRIAIECSDGFCGGERLAHAGFRSVSFGAALKIAALAGMSALSAVRFAAPPTPPRGSFNLRLRIRSFFRQPPSRPGE